VVSHTGLTWDECPRIAAGCDVATIVAAGCIDWWEADADDDWSSRRHTESTRHANGSTDSPTDPGYLTAATLAVGRQPATSDATTRPKHCKTAVCSRSAWRELLFQLRVKLR